MPAYDMRISDWSSDVCSSDLVEVGAPGAGEVRVRQTAVAVNYIDTYQRSGLYPMKLPAVIGNEAAGVVEAVGQGVTSLKTGERIAYPGLLGAYDEARLLPADKVVKIPDGIENQQAADMMIKRTEERRVGKECVRKGRKRGWP